MQKCLHLVMDIGEEMLISGAEVHRVEESINRMAKAFSSNMDSFLEKAIYTLQLASALAIGIILATTLARIVTKIKYKTQKP